MFRNSCDSPNSLFTCSFSLQQRFIPLHLTFFRVKRLFYYGINKTKYPYIVIICRVIKPITDLKKKNASKSPPYLYLKC